MTQKRPYSVLHLEIDATTPIERDAPGEPSVELEMRPIGIQLPPDEQIRELRVAIVSVSGAVLASTTLDESGIEALKAFLEMRP